MHCTDVRWRLPFNPRDGISGDDTLELDTESFLYFLVLQVGHEFRP